jgi:protease YdgD
MRTFFIFCVWCTLSLAHAMVINHDSRSFLENPYGPYRMVGVVEASDGQVCTGTLIGEDLVLTAAHCLEREGRRLRAIDLRFHSHYHYGVSQGLVSEVQGFYLGVRPQRAGDWAILKLKQKLGLQLGYLSSGVFDQRDLHRVTIFIPGYDVGFSRNVGLSLAVNQLPARVKHISEGLYYHDAPTGVGASGGPLLQFKNGQWIIVGITVAEAKRGGCRSFNLRDCHNIAIPESAWRETLKKLL